VVVAATCVFSCHGYRDTYRVNTEVSILYYIRCNTLHTKNWVPGVLSLGVKRGWDVMLATHPQMIPRSRMGRSYTTSFSLGACMT
jgi:hypothetical protein